jgi:hypothetical protein
MNPNNYGTLEACKRLIDAGIVLETDFFWATYPERTLQSLKDAGKAMPSPYIIGKESIHNKHLIGMGSYIPAPSMAEVWRELPNGKMEVYYHNGDAPYYSFQLYSFQLRQIGTPLYSNTSPTDALIDLLIWIKTEGKDEKR